MASVAICPHCYLQLVVPDGLEPDERVECPTCAKEFGLDQAVLRAIPEVVRRPASKPSIAAPAVEPTNDELLVAEIEVEEEIVVTAEGTRESDVIEQIKAQIESEIEADRLPAGTNTMLPLSLPADEEMPHEKMSDDIGQQLLGRDDDEVDAEFSHRDTVPELPAAEFEGAEISIEEDFNEDVLADDADEVRAVADGEIDSGEDEIVIESLEERAARPTVRTLSDWMPANRDAEQDEIDELEETPGPSFDLPNVPLTPSNGSTVEFDPNMSFGPAAESEFELDDVDFDAVSDEISADDENAVDDSYVEPAVDPVDDDAPVFREPTHGALPAAPFLLPGVPQRRRKRSVVRTLIGTALGGVVGLTLGYGVLLYLLGPEGDLLQVTKYIPESMLPESFGGKPTVVAETAPSPAPSTEQEPATTDLAADEQPAADEHPADAKETADETAPADDEVLAVNETSGEESTNVQTGYVADAKPSDESSPAAESATDDRYGSEPSPLEEPAAEPIASEQPHENNDLFGATPEPMPTTPPLPIHGPLFTVDQLATALEAGKAAEAGLTTGDLNDAAVRRTKGMSYAKLCDLAEAVTFVDRSSPSVESADAIEGTDHLFRETLSDSRTRAEVARISQIWINSPHRAHGGVFLAGSISGGEIAGEIYEYELTTDDGSKLRLLAQEPLDPAVAGSNRPVGIVGTIIEKPSDEIAGYHGTAGRAIWIARAIPLD